MKLLTHMADVVKNYYLCGLASLLLVLLVVAALLVACTQFQVEPPTVVPLTGPSAARTMAPSPTDIATDSEVIQKTVGPVPGEVEKESLEIVAPKNKEVTPINADTSTSKPEASPAAQSLTGTWKLLAYKNLNTGETEFEPEGITRSIILEFQDNGKRGTITGHTVTNNVQGEYEIAEHNKIKISEFGGTKVAEPAWGSKFWTVIGAASSYELKNDSLLVYLNNDNELMEFVESER